MDVAEAVAESYGHPRVAEFAPRLAADAGAAFSGGGVTTRGEFLRTMHAPGAVEAWRRIIDVLAELAPDSARHEIIEALWRQDVKHRGEIAAATGLTPLETASYVAHSRRGLAMAARQANKGGVNHG